MAAHELGMLARAPKTSVLLTLPSDTPELSTLAWVGPVSQATTEQLTCDATITTIIVDGETVPLQMGRDRRLFPAHLRRRSSSATACVHQMWCTGIVDPGTSHRTLVAGR